MMRIGHMNKLIDDTDEERLAQRTSHTCELFNFTDLIQVFVYIVLFSYQISKSVTFQYKMITTS